MFTKRNVSLLTGLLLLISANYVQAESSKGSIQLHMSVEKEVVVTNAAGQPETRRVPADKVFPSDKVVYTIKYENTGSEEAEQVLITNPLPEHMTYIDGTAVGENAVITFSVDGGKTFDLQQNLTVTGDHGKTRKAAAPDYTHIRWTLQNHVPANATGAVSFWAQLE